MVRFLYVFEIACGFTSVIVNRKHGTTFSTKCIIRPVCISDIDIDPKSNENSPEDVNVIVEREVPYG